MSSEVEFVFSFRSPFAWIASRHVLPMLSPETSVRWTPFLPLPTFTNFRGGMPPGKVRHNLQEILRLTEAYGLPIGRPPVDEPEWVTAHAAFLFADRCGKGPEFGQALMDERWVRGEWLSKEATIRRVASSVGLDADRTAEAAGDEALRADLTQRVQTNYDERDLFGVPMFVLPSGEMFWGHDRMEWAIRHGFVRAAA
jgi:2-hydroxychromene-2-carboxylate isomerase